MCPGHVPASEVRAQVEIVFARQTSLLLSLMQFLPQLLLLLLLPLLLLLMLLLLLLLQVSQLMPADKCNLGNQLRGTTP